eukprot:TRINITY_DN7989_c0_g2_i1.p1 TRINITY_DN7989_c0_g2~~TRINITY_DN7989_c0_g2_i1.p1  ORF type:complete len:109 (-),score=2.52 TRINITY_DN7989_c0_g2_i1:169-495(-)
MKRAIIFLLVVTVIYGAFPEIKQEVCSDYGCTGTCTPGTYLTNKCLKTTADSYVIANCSTDGFYFTEYLYSDSACKSHDSTHKIDCNTCEQIYDKVYARWSCQQSVSS